MRLFERETLQDVFLSCCEWGRIYYAWRPNLRDEGDNHLGALAIAGSAQAIVPKNLRDVANMALSFPHLRVIAPEVILQELHR
jgi:predicted nucleic acid-binding protein